MSRWLSVCLCLLASAPAFAQPRTIAPGDIRCAHCAGAAQRPDAAGFDASTIEFVPNPVPAFHEGQTFRINLIARVVHAAPLMLETLDSGFEMVDRSMRVVEKDRSDGQDPATCGTPARMPAVDLASKPVVSTLKLNDLVTGAIIMKRDEKMPDALIAGTPVLTNVHRLPAPVRLFHPAPIAASCVNHSGRLVVYSGPVDGELTEVYNDGTIYHRNAAYLEFVRERLSPAEIADLLSVFRAVHFDALPAAYPASQNGERSVVALIAARYQPVKVKGNETRLAPLVKRLDALAARAMSHAQYIVKSEKPIPLIIAPWSYPEIALDAFVDRKLRGSANAPAAWGQRVPDAFLARLPLSDSGDPAASDPNRAVLFKEGGKIYRVAKPFYCKLGGPCTFRQLEATEVAEPVKADPPLSTGSGLLWPRDMGVRLRTLAAGGTVISRDEYEKHKTIYFPLLRMRALGSNYIEDGVLYPRVRVCQIEPGSADTCALASAPR